MPGMIKTLLTSGILLISAGTFFQSCKRDKNIEPPPEGRYIMPDSVFRTIKIDTVGECPLVNAITLTGQVDFNNDNLAKIYPVVSGNISDVNVMLGDYVKQGQVLGVITSSEMAGYSRDYISAKTNLGLAEKNVDATQDMLNSGLSSQRDLINAQASYEQAKSEMARVSSIMKINGGNGDNYIIRSPINGFIVEKNVTNNMFIRADNNANMFTISNLNNVWVMANAYESNISNVHVGDSAIVSTLAYPDKVFSGKVDEIMNVLDPANKVMKVRVVLSNPNYLLKPQMFANVTITNKENTSALCISSQALIFDNSQYYVLVYKSRADIEIKPVQIISTIGNKTYISSGIEPNDLLIGSQALLIYQALNS